MNMQAGRFEALDSMHGEGNMSLTVHANLLVSRIKKIWNIHYSTSKVQIQDWDLKIINVPLQENMYVEWFFISFSSFFLFFIAYVYFYIYFLPLLVDLYIYQLLHRFDCGYHAIYNTDKWDGQNVSALSKENAAKTRRILPFKWLTTDFNEEKDNWKWCLFNNAIR
jgi:hypothetical protein